MNFKNIFFGILTIIAVSIIVPGCDEGDDKSKSFNPKEIEVDAYIMSQDFVKDQLKAPSTAEFPSGSIDRVAYIGDSTFVVKAYVDAQNSFGAKIRTNFISKVKFLGDDKWSDLGTQLLER